MLHLVEDLAGRRQRLGEHRVFGARSSATTRRLRSGSVKNSRNAPGRFTIPNTVRRGQ